MRQSQPSSGLFLRLRPVGLALRSATFSQREKDMPSGRSLIWTPAVIDRRYKEYLRRFIISQQDLIKHRSEHRQDHDRRHNQRRSVTEIEIPHIRAIRVHRDGFRRAARPAAGHRPYEIEYREGL